MAAADVPEPKPPPLEAVRAEQIRLLYENGRTPMLSTYLAGALTAVILVYSGVLSVSIAGVWVGVMTAHTGFRLWLREAYFKARPAAADWRRWANRFTAGAVAGGLTWGVGSFWLLPPARIDLQMLVVAVMFAIVYGTVTSWASYLPAFYPFFILAFGPVIAWFALQGDLVHWAATAMFLTWGPTVVMLARRYNANLVQALQLRFENAALVEDLTAQKAIAEQASLAKSRFLASASHDLRQPVHALGMFIGALRNHRLPKRSVDLVDQMDVSVGALDNLFSSLLDISRLDAGVIESRPATLPVQPLLARICRELEPEAEAKGLDLVLVPTEACVRSDPVLLERVMRNLIGNAIRYTEKGWVLVGCRRRGRRFCLEVRDTGPGIAPAQQEAVFEEFYQVGNPDRDRAKGLGLGLPIVRRLTAILDHPLEMESTPGQGTTFRVLVPRAPAPRAAAPGEPAPAAAELRTGLILAIDDEQAIRVAMAELIKSWGHEVIAVPGPDEALTALRGRRPPDLIICDHRLRDGITGVEAIRRIHAELGFEIPAVLVTGDTAPENIREALASGLPLMHKPLSHARLRAAVTNLIRRKAAPIATTAAE